MARTAPTEAVEAEITVIVGNRQASAGTAAATLMRPI